MNITSAAAAKAYGALGNLPGIGQEAAKSASGDTPDFGAMLRSAVESVTEAGRSTEAQAGAMVDGKADLINMVTAVAETETAFETMVTLRDRVVSAYEEILRMPI